MNDARSTLRWPVCWDPVVSLAEASGQHPEALVHDPRLAAHRVLDRLAAMAFDAADGVFGSADAFADAINELLHTVPWLTPDRVGGADMTVSARRRTTVIDVSSDEATTSGSSQQTPHRRESADGQERFAAVHAMIDGDGVDALEKLASGLAGAEAGRVIRQLAAAASGAERMVPGLAYRHDPGYAADVATLAGTAAGERDWQPGAESPQGVTSLGRLSITAPSSVCEMLKERVNEQDLLENPQPEGSPVSTAGIERVDVTNPCSASPLLTIHGSGFGISQPVGKGVIAATWDTALSRAVYRNITVSSWSDTAVVAQLPDNATSGTAAFADLQAIRDYNNWVDGRNKRVSDAMHAGGCPGTWTVEVHYSEDPGDVPAAHYTVGSARVIADVAPATGQVDRWNASTLHLQTNQGFRISWQATGADTITLLPVDAGARQILATAGYPTTGVTLGASGSLDLAATPDPARATFTVQAPNACGTVEAPVQLMITGPPLQPASVAMFQPVAGGDVKVSAGPAGETLQPASGETIPLVAGKRSVAVIDWWLAVPQMPTGEALVADATLQVSGELVGYPGVTLQPSRATADPAPPATPVQLNSGPPFASLAAYQQWVAADVGNNPETFNVVLPAEICLGGDIPGTSVQGWTVLAATINVRSLDGPSWTLAAGNNVTFYPRRKVRIRYRAWGRTINVPMPQPAPSDAICLDALRRAASLLPIPDPEIVPLPGPPYEWDGHLVEDMVAERGGTPAPQWRDEIWVLVGPPNTGGVANVVPGSWVAAVDTSELTATHEICHLFDQNHLKLCGLPTGDDPSTFPNGGTVVVPGWDMWTSTWTRSSPGFPVRDIMVRSYCPEPTWPAPERWRRVFLKVGPA